jgi:general secretion pathway protein E
MFFSKRKPNEAQLLAMRASADAKLRSTRPPAPRAAPPESGTLSRDFIDTTTLTIDSEITEIKDVPQGTYWRFADHGIPGVFAESFAVIASGNEFAVLLVANEAFASHPLFDLQRRLKEAGLTKLTIRRATREIVRAVHQENEAQTDNGKGDDSAAEVAAWAMLNSAIELGASDIHLQTRGSFAQVFCRIHGDRVEQPNISNATATAICNVLYTVHGDADSKGISWDPKEVCGTSFDHKSPNGTQVQIRFSSRPIHPAGNFKAVMRILVMDALSAKPLEEFGHTPAQTEEIEEMLVGAQGMVLLVGPTNSGKSTLLQALVSRIYDRRGISISVDTLERPVEYLMLNACQTAVPEGRRGADEKNMGASFTAFLQGFLQQDPDVLVFGEIRGREAAIASMEAVLAGRKLLTTLHAYDPFAVFARLREMGVPSSVLYMPGFISGIVYQRLVRELCPHCAIPIDDAYSAGTIREAVFNRVMRVIDRTKHKVMTKGHGCEKCNSLGIIGRTACAAVVRPDDAMLRLLGAGDEIGARERWKAIQRLDIDGLGVSQVAHAIAKMREGRLDPTDIERQVGPLLADVDLVRPTTRHRDAPADDLPAALR